MPTPTPTITASALQALQLVAQLRYLTIPLLVAHLGVSPDAAYRLVRRLARGGLLRTVRWGRGGLHGPPSIVAVMTARGASALAASGYEERPVLARLVRATASRARDVDAGLVTTLGHDLDVLQLHALLTLAVRGRTGVTLWWPQWGRAFRAPLVSDPALFDAAARLRLLGDRRGTTVPIVTYVPDAVVLLDDADGRRHVLLLEVETGKGGRTARAIGTVKGAKMLAVWTEIRLARSIDGVGTVDPGRVTFATWCPTDSFRDGFLAGARRTLAGAALPLIATSATAVPLHLPAGVPKCQVAAWLAAAAAPALGPVWLGLAGDAAALLPAGDAPPGDAPLGSAVAVAQDVGPRAQFDPFGSEPFIAL